MLLTDVLNIEKLYKHVELKNVSIRSHDTQPWSIINYTPKVQFEKLWDDVTIICRGLIYNYNTLEVIARPFPKFFNLEEVKDKIPNTATNITVSVFEKLDGALGIGVLPGVIATRGSFNSDQAYAATNIWNRKYQDVTWPEGYTPLWEIIHPCSRVVVDYGSMEDLILLGLINIKTGKTDYTNTSWWPGPIAKQIDYEEFIKTRDAKYNNSEGFVLYFHDYDFRVKVKHPEYVELHRIVVGLNEKYIFDCIKNNVDLNSMTEKLPDELYKWVQKTIDKVWDKYWEINDIVMQLWVKRPKNVERKEFAEWAKQQEPYTAMLFKLLDDKQLDYQNQIFKQIEREIFNV